MCENTAKQELVIQGGKQLKGELSVQGSKNSVLPILAATICVEGVSIIHNCPKLTDVAAAIKILEYLGCKVKQEGETVIVDSRSVQRWDIPEKLMHEMRSSIVFLGPLLSRFGQAEVSPPGGCEIGLRPINLHISAMQTLGVTVRYEPEGRLFCSTEVGLCGETITLSLPSVGATENIMLAAATATGNTTIINAAREPEISDLANFLNSSGARIHGAGEGTIYIEGVKTLRSCEHRTIPDRIMASTFMAAAAATQGSITLYNVIPAHISPIFTTFEDTCCDLHIGNDFITIHAPRRLCRFRTVRTMPYPGFPTDSQATTMAMACVARGTSMIIENIFESRYKQAVELCRMGAEIEVEGRMAVIEGVPYLHGANVTAMDLRGGAALVVAGLAAMGTTRISAVNLIDRGYQDIESNLISIGADVKREEIYEQTGHKKAVSQ